MPQLSETVFSTQPDKELIVEDAYKKKDNEVVNDGAFAQADAASAAPAEVAPPEPLSQLTSESVQSQPVATVEAGNMAETIKDQGNKVSSSIQGLSGGVKDAITTANTALNTVRTAANQAVAGVTQTVNGVSQQIQGAALGALKGVGNAISGMTGGAVQVSFQDKMAVGKLGANLVAQADSLGIQGAYGMITSAPMDTQVLNSMTQNLVPVAVSTGSLGLLSDMSMGPAAAQVKIAMPNVVSQFAQNYVAPVGQTANQAIVAGKQMIDTFDRIDQGWSTGVNGAVNVSAFAKASPSTQKVMGALSASASVNIAGVNVNATIGTTPARTGYNKIGAAVTASAKMSTSMGSISATVGTASNPFGTQRTSQSQGQARVSLSQSFPMTVPIVPPQRAPQRAGGYNGDEWIIE